MTVFANYLWRFVFLHFIQMFGRFVNVEASNCYNMKATNNEAWGQILCQSLFSVGEICMYSYNNAGIK